MSASISVKKIPDEILVRLRARARRHRRSLQGEVMAILEDAVRPTRLTVSELRARVRELRLGTGSEATSMIRRERDAR